ncbi:hypothetical protein [Chryseobacterium mulctrae]|uniref:hypothetical protein n=1 Tax=Chryseobacterium mulctrae TaxID=2576777 RepID=UPI001117205F|nr:hypothetical protein [Chryseobacterium mulctrae]
MEKKSILIVDPFEKMSKILIEELNNLDYNAIPLFKEKMKSFDYSQVSRFDKLKNIFHRFFFKNNNYYHVLLEKFYQKYTEDLLENIIKQKTKIDYALIFRPHGFSSKFYKHLTKLTSEISLYEYDGLYNSRALILKKNQKYVKNIFLFDHIDLAKIEGAKFITNYHYTILSGEEDEKYDFYYLGSHSDERITNLTNFINCTQKYNKEINIQAPKNLISDNENIKFITQAIDYKDYLLSIKNTKAIIDLKSPIHNGLSFRFFEGLNLEKKIITNNHSVKNYNFYHPDNIFITDYESFDGLEEFMQKTYHPMPNDIVKMYSLENWIKNIFEMGDYIPIPIPKITQ